VNRFFVAFTVFIRRNAIRCVHFSCNGKNDALSGETTPNRADLLILIRFGIVASLPETKQNVRIVKQKCPWMYFEA
jgi:hypothetical protein